MLKAKSAREVCRLGECNYASQTPSLIRGNTIQGDCLWNPHYGDELEKGKHKGRVEKDSIKVEGKGI